MNFSARPDCWTAATESPPPTTTVAPRLATSASTPAIPSVPVANAATSKIPIGPFHSTVRASRSREANRVRVSGPMSTPTSAASSASTATTREGEVPSGVAETSTSVGRTSSTFRALAFSSTARAMSIRSSSTSDLPVGRPCAR